MATTARPIHRMRAEDPFEATNGEAPRRPRDAALRCAASGGFVPLSLWYYAAEARTAAHERGARAQHVNQIGIS
jgi:hypothetical protein